MESKEVLLRCLHRAQEFLNEATATLTQDEIAWRPGPEANPIGFILWHLSRVEDRFVNVTIRQDRQVWEAGEWPNRLGLPADPVASGFRFSPEQVAAFPVPDLSALLAYQQSVREATLAFIDGLSAADMDRTVSHPRIGDQPLAALLARMVVEVSQHAGQIDYIRGLARHSERQG